MIVRFCLLVAIGILIPLAAFASPPGDTVKLTDCLLSLDEEVQVPAQEAGVLVDIFVREGQLVAKDKLLAQIDDVVPEMQRRVNESKLKVAQEQATNDIDIRYAKAGADVYAIKYEKSLQANLLHPGVVVEVDLNEQRLERDKFILSIEKAEKDMKVAGYQMEVSKAELLAAEANVKRRNITAPLDAVVEELSRHTGDWVQQGETVMRLVRVDRLRVEGSLNAREYMPWEIDGRPVSVNVEFARGQRETFPGKIVFVSRLIKSGHFQVRAEVQNRQQNGVWLLSSGLPAEMTIKLK